MEHVEIELPGFYTTSQLAVAEGITRAAVLERIKNGWYSKVYYIRYDDNVLLWLIPRGVQLYGNTSRRQA